MLGILVLGILMQRIPVFFGLSCSSAFSETPIVTSTTDVDESTTATSKLCSESQSMGTELLMKDSYDAPIPQECRQNWSQMSRCSGFPEPKAH